MAQCDIPCAHAQGTRDTAPDQIWWGNCGKALCYIGHVSCADMPLKGVYCAWHCVL